MDILHLPAFITAKPNALLVKRVVDPAAATASLLAALPSSILNIVVTNPDAAATAILLDITGSTTAAWFAGLPAEVQSYFITSVGGAAAPAPATPTTTRPTTTTTPRTTPFSTNSNGVVVGTSAVPQLTTLKTSPGRDSISSSSYLTAVSASANPGTGATQNHKSLSTGAKAGIAVGVILGLALLAAVLFGIFFCLRLKKNRPSAVVETHDEKSYIAPSHLYTGDPIPEMEGKPVLLPSHTQVLSKEPISELPHDGHNMSQLPHNGHGMSELPSPNTYVPNSYSTAPIPIAARSPSVMEKEVVPSHQKEVLVPTGSSIISQNSDQTLGGPGSVESVLERLREEQEKIAAKRQRLKALQELDEQDEAVNQQISALLSQSRS